MSIPDGRYTLRASPAVGVGGMYATGQNEVDAPVTTAAQVPDAVGRQNWEIKTVNAEDNTYTISLWTNGSTFGGSFSPENCEGNLEGPIVTSQREFVWTIEPFDTGIPDTYRISTGGEVIGVQNLVGTDGNQVYLQSFPVILSQEGKPYWKLEKVD